jgi:thiamine biosynthesis lipoprotein
VQAGGDFYAGGTHDGKRWRLGIADPRGLAGETFARIEITDRTFSTSGDYERAFISGGVRYHHLLDPDTGRPAVGCRSVTIVADHAVLADALSTGVFILGPGPGMDLVERLPGIDAVIVGADNEVRVSSGLRDRFVLLAPPTDGP